MAASDACRANRAVPHPGRPHQSPDRRRALPLAPDHRGPPATRHGEIARRQPHRACQTGDESGDAGQFWKPNSGDTPSRAHACAASRRRAKKRSRRFPIRVRPHGDGLRFPMRTAGLGVLRWAPYGNRLFWNDRSANARPGTGKQTRHVITIAPPGSALYRAHGLAVYSQAAMLPWGGRGEDCFDSLQRKERAWRCGR